MRNKENIYPVSSEILRKARKRKGLSQLKLASNVISTTRSICDFEHGIKRPNKRLLDLLVKELGISDIDKSKMVGEYEVPVFHNNKSGWIEG